MARIAKPYKERGWYISRAGGEYIKLCPISEGLPKAKRLLHDHLEKRQQERKTSDGKIPTRLNVIEMFALFLESVEAEKSEATYAYYQRWCGEFAKKHGTKQIRDVTRFDANQFKQLLLTTTWKLNNQPPKKYKPKTIGHALITLRRAFNWAIDNEFLPKGTNPFARIKSPHAEGRKRIATQEEFQALFDNCKDDHFRDVLIAMRYTSARPGDVRNLAWSMVKWDEHCWLIHKHKTTSTCKTRLCPSF